MFEATANQFTSSTTFVDVTGAVLNIVAGDRPLLLHMVGLFAGPGTVGASSFFKILDTTTGLDLIIAELKAPTAGWYAYQAYIKRLAPLAPGAHTLKMQMRVSAGASGGFYGSAANPMQFMVSER